MRLPAARPRGVWTSDRFLEPPADGGVGPKPMPLASANAGLAVGTSDVRWGVGGCGDASPCRPAPCPPAIADTHRPRWHRR